MQHQFNNNSFSKNSYLDDSHIFHYETPSKPSNCYFHESESQDFGSAFNNDQCLNNQAPMAKISSRIPTTASTMDAPHAYFEEQAPISASKISTY